MRDFRYHYDAIVREAYDGDTITSADIDLGLGVWVLDQTVRLYGINTPELRDKDPDERARAFQARDFLRQATIGRDVIFRTHKDRTGKYGRWLATVFVLSADREKWHNINEELVKAGLAEKRNYR